MKSILVNNIDYSHSVKQLKGVLQTLMVIALVTAMFAVAGCSPPHPH